MKRYLILEIPEEGNEGLHDLTDLVESMREHDGGTAYLRAAGLVLDVKIPARFDASLVGQIGGSELDIYTSQGA